MTTEQAQHTPTPWRFEPMSDLISPGYRILGSEWRIPDVAAGAIYENAAFIVTAVNAYERNQAIIEAFIVAVPLLIKGCESLITGEINNLGVTKWKTVNDGLIGCRDAIALAASGEKGLSAKQEAI